MRSSVAAAKPHIGERRGKAREVRLLRQIAHERAWLHENRATVGLGEAGRDLEQRGFARPVAPTSDTRSAAATVSSAPVSSGVPPTSVRCL